MTEKRTGKSEWWFTDGQGRRIGYMWPEDFESVMQSYYGDDWVERFREEFHLTRPTVYRYLKGDVPIPKTVAQAVTMMIALRNAKVPRPAVPADWIPHEVAKGQPRSLTEDAKV